MSARRLSEIAQDVQEDWNKPYFGAAPYLAAMMTMGTIDEDYGCDPGREIVLYFLSNATTWRGPVARAVKKELKAIAGLKA